MYLDILDVFYTYPKRVQDTFRIHIRYIRIHVSYALPLRAFLLAGVPTLQQLQGRAREMKRAKTAAVHIEQLIDLKHLALSYFEPMPAPLTLMPPSGTQLDVS